MNGTIITLKVNGSKVITKLDRASTLEDIQAAIGGGHIEFVPRFDRINAEGNYYECVAFCDEEGKQKGLPVNTFATQLWAIILNRNVNQLGDYLAGDIAIVFGDAEFMEAL